MMAIIVITLGRWRTLPLRLVDIADILAAGAAFPSPQQPTPQQHQRSDRKESTRFTTTICCTSSLSDNDTPLTTTITTDISSTTLYQLCVNCRITGTCTSTSWGYITTTWCRWAWWDKGTPESGAYTLSTPGGRKKNPSMGDVEVGWLTRLAEIMLHPLTQILNGNYYWRDEFTMPETCNDGKLDQVLLTACVVSKQLIIHHIMTHKSQQLHY